jgi:hypothetical protein
MLGMTGCGTPHPNGEFSDPLAKFKTVPLDVIDALPERIARLPVTKSIR